MTATSAPPRYSSPVSVEAMRAGDGAQAIRFIQKYGRVTKTSVGGRAGSKLRLRPFQQKETYRLLARDPATGRRQHRVALIGMARKNGKSGWGSGIAIYGLETEDAGAEIYICAADKDQARIVGNACRRMVELDPYLSRRFRVYKNEIVDPRKDSFIRILSADASTKDGYNPSLVMFDEVHAQPDSELWDAMALGMGARIDPLMVGITTAGKRYDRAGNSTLCHRLYEYGTQIHSGEVIDPTFCFTWWEPSDPTADHLDPHSWWEANPGLDDLVSSADLASVAKRTDEAMFRTKRCNMWVSSAVTAIPHGRFEKLVNNKRKRGRDMVATGGGRRKVPVEWLRDSVLFLDGSWSGDSTGIVGCTRDGFLFVVTHHEKNQFDGPEWRVPVNSVKADIMACFEAGARVMGYDPYRWQQTGADLAEAGIPLFEWPTNSLQRIIPAWKDYYAAIMDEQIRHTGDPALVRHHANLSLKIDARGARPTKEHATSIKRIDLGICAIGAYANRNLEPEVKKQRKPWVLST